jgi:NADH:ubiquinone oxidoreductase subunit 6 (subunit J)
MMVNTNETELSFRRKSNLNLLISVFLLVAGFVFMAVASISGKSQLLITGAGLMLSGVGLVLLVYELALVRDIERINGFSLEQIRSSLAIYDKSLSQRLKLARTREAFGLVEVCEDSANFDYSQLILESRMLVVVLNDGRTWASVHRDHLRRRFADSTKATTFVMCHPTSPMLQVLARKSSTDVQSVQSRILDTVRLLREIKQQNTVLEVLGHHLFNPYSLILGDSRAMVTPYFFSRGGHTVPVLTYEDMGKPCYFRDLAADVERLRMDSQDIRDLAGSGELSQLADWRIE